MRKYLIYSLFCIMLISVFMSFAYTASAGTILSLIQEGVNQASDENREYLIDREGTVPGQLDVGDSLRGVVNITTLNSTSANVGGISGNNELSAVFQVLVTGKTNVGGGLFLYTFGPDPAFEADIGGGMTSTGFVPGAGAIMVLFEDPTNNFAAEFDDPPPAAPPAGSDDGTPGRTVPPSSADVSVGPYSTEEAFIATAANGTWFGTLGFKGIPGEGALGMTTVPGFDNVLTAFSMTSGSTGANTNFGLNVIALGPASGGLTVNRVTPSPFGGFVDFALSQQHRGVSDLDTPFEISSNTNISFNATTPVCGDGIVGNTPGETCDTNPQPPINGSPLDLRQCRQPGTDAQCTYCGDGIINNGEQCDDGNSTNGDGCDNNCTILQVGGCRMTGGHVKFYADGTSVTVPYDAVTYKVTPVLVKKGKSFVTQNQVTWYTLGGQIGAPQAACLNTPDTAFGDWEHNHHEGSVLWPAGSQDSLSWPAGSFSGGFAFHSGTASAPDEAFIKCITCADAGWCVQARCAPFKQIFWEGTGVFHNIDAGTSFPNCTPQVPGRNKPGTIHYYRALVGDFGEPAGSSEQQKPADQCGWTSAGVSLLNGVLDGVTIVPWPLDEHFGYKGGQNCSAYPSCDKGDSDPSNDTCGECPDWYEIEIHCDANPSPLVCKAANGTGSKQSCQTNADCPMGETCQSNIIYKVGNFITHGNHQIHPEVGDQCTF